MEPLNPEQMLARLLDAERLMAPEPGAQNRDFQRLKRALGVGAPALAIGSMTLKTSSALAKLGSGLAVGLVVGVGAAAGVQAFTPAQERFAAQPPIAAPAIANGSSRPLLQPLPESRSALPSEQPVVEAVPVRAEKRPLDVQPAPSAARVGPAFDDELRLIELAKKQVDAGQPHLARIWLSEHQSRYPHGVFSVERQALSTLVTCAEHAPNAGQAAADFTRAFPSSPFIDRIRSACPDPSSNKFADPK